MKYLKTIGLCLVAVFALSAVAVSSAFASPVWKLAGATVTTNMTVGSSGTLKLTDSKTSIGSVTVTCEGTDKGTVGASGIDTTTTITATKCSSSNKECKSPTAKAVGLPWKTQLVEVGGKLEDEVTNTAGKLGWDVECTVVIIKVSDECTRASTHTEITNVAGGVDAIFSPAVGGKAKCTQSGEETGSVEGTVLNTGEEKAKLEAEL